MFKLLVPLLAKNSCYENANLKAAYCIKNSLISSSSATNVMENFALRRHFLFSTTNRKTIQAFPTKPQHHQLEVSYRCLGEKQLELLPTDKVQRITFIRKFNSSSNNVLFVESTEAANTSTSKEKSELQEASKRDSFNKRKQTSLYTEEDEENTFDIM